jgi:hypothetical protein
MKIETLKIEEIIEYENNPRENSLAVDKIAESIKSFGFVNPISITKDNVIISGHTRLLAAKKLGMTDVPCIRHELEVDEASILRIVENKSHEFSTWDIGRLQNEKSKTQLPYATNFFPVARDSKFFVEQQILSFGNVSLKMTDDDYYFIKNTYDNYVDKNQSFFGFVSFLLGGI